MNILGKILPHDDTDADRSENSKLATSYETTKQLWEANGYGEYYKPGAMYRGKAPDEKNLLPSLITKDFGADKIITMILRAVSIGPMVWPEECHAEVQVNLYTQGAKRNPSLIHEGSWLLGSKSVLDWTNIDASFEMNIGKQNYIGMNVIDSPEVSKIAIYSNMGS